MSSTRTEFLAKDRRRRPDSENVEFNTIVPAKVRFCYTGAGSASSRGREPPADGDRAPDSFLFQKWLLALYRTKQDIGRLRQVCRRPATIFLERWGFHGPVHD